MEVAVIGSGVSGVAAAHALAARGASVTILDVGEVLENRRQAVVDRLHDLPSSEWPPEDFRLIDENPTYAEAGLPKKVHFGSDYIYADDRPFSPLTTLAKGRIPYPTFAKGGFSNIWGAAVLPTDSCDMADWPLTRAEMDPYFEKVAALMPLAGGEGTLSRAFPAYRETGTLAPGPQGAALLDDLERAGHRLLERDTLFGKARLAVHTEAADDGILPCNGCGHCFTGCVRGSIYSTHGQLERLKRDHGLRHRTGIFVDEVDEAGAKVRLKAVDAKTLQACELEFDAAFVACGPINTTRLLLQSKGLYDHRIELRESQKFVLPMLRLRPAETAITHPSISLASVFLETKVRKLSDHWVHAQIVPMNEMIVRSAHLPPPSQKTLRRLMEPMLRRMMAAWCGMHSDHSSAVELCLKRDGGRTSRLELNLLVSDKARRDARVAARDLFRKGLLFGTLFCFWMIRFSNPGSGTHCGGSFPMRRTPKAKCDSDRLGRPYGWSKIFVVDSSVLPSIPGTTLALPTMANAYRIATEAPL
jgi:choline dehydrogenase-like flavoprotein